MVAVLALAIVDKVAQGALDINGVVDVQALQIAGHASTLHALEIVRPWDLQVPFMAMTKYVQSTMTSNIGLAANDCVHVGWHSRMHQVVPTMHACCHAESQAGLSVMHEHHACPERKGKGGEGGG